MTAPTIIHWARGTDGIVVLTMDDPDRSANTMNTRFVAALAATVDRLEAEREQITGVLLTSAKPTFFAGGDLRELRETGTADAAAVFASAERIKACLRRLETLGRPVVAAVNGAALGGGLEIALACHHRIALDDERSRIGLPEVTLGLLPGGGGITRTVRMLGVRQALAGVLLSGRRFRPAEALAAGLVDEVTATQREQRERARAWIAANPAAAQPWDLPGHRVPDEPSLTAALPSLPAALRKQLRGANYPAPRAILAAAVEGAQVDFATASTIESRYFAGLATGQVAKNMINTFFDRRHVASGGSRPPGHPPHRATRVVVLGAGLMGAGIAYACAAAGLEVVLKDVTRAAAERGKAYAEKILGEAARITATDSVHDAAGADLVIEAVFESSALKARVLAEIEQVVAPDAVIASNTSTLPITELAAAVRRPADFVGLHFFSPVEKMELLEVIGGEQTSDATLAKAFDLARQIGKTPILVHDSRGFFTSRVIIKYLEEAAAMVGEGLDAASIEQAGLQAGYPVPPLQLLDELALPLIRGIREEARAAATRWEAHGSEAVIDRLIDEYGRPGRAGDGGFYSYADGKRAGLWTGLAAAFRRPGHAIPLADMRDRLLFAEAVDSVRCLDEGVLRSAADANVGSILGIGFPRWTGGVIQYVHGYPGGVDAFVARANELAGRYGPRLAAPPTLTGPASGSGPAPSRTPA